MSTSNFSHIYINGKIQPVYGITTSDFPESYFDEKVDLSEYTEDEKKEVCLQIANDDMSYLYDLVVDNIDEINSDLRFFQITVKLGYYDGFQLFIEGAEDAYTMNEKRQQNKELRKVLKLMRQIAKRNGLKCYTVAAKFSTGETWYYRKAVA